MNPTQTAPRAIKVPGPDHPITIEPNRNRVVVRLAGTVIADTRDALTLVEAGYPPVQYIPITDVAEGALAPTDKSTYCPYKGDASYFDILEGGAEARNAVWSYREPYAAVVAIREHVAFYPDRVSIEEVPGA